MAREVWSCSAVVKFVLCLSIVTRCAADSENDYYQYKVVSHSNSEEFSVKDLDGLEVTRTKRYLAGEPSETKSLLNPRRLEPRPTDTYQTDHAAVSVNISTLVPTASSVVSVITNKTITAEVQTTTTSSLQIPNTTLSSVNRSTTQSTLSKSTNLIGVDMEESALDRFPEIISNDTLSKNNVTRGDEDHHVYYNSSFIVNNEAVGMSYWVDMSNNSDAQVNILLSQSYRRAATIKLSFAFPFYGHLVKNVTVATGGFLYTGDYVHSWLAITQYIAPLMANFDTSLSNRSFVKYLDNGTAFTVQWENVRLQDSPSVGDFSFQATLHANGDIVFVYQNIPVLVENITDIHHPVKIGLSDAYIIDRTIFHIRRKTIYEYHRVKFDQQDIRNWTVIYLYALPTCLDMPNCTACTTHNPALQCGWCSSANRCSNDYDRHRQDWLQRQCDKIKVLNVEQCSVLAPVTTQTTDDISTKVMPEDVKSAASSLDDSIPLKKDAASTSSITISGIVAILFVMVLIFATGLWILYAYRNPHTASGQFLIRYRPAQWSWRRGEARYTAATIHM